LNKAGQKLSNVHYATADGTAVAGTDYRAPSGTLKIAARKRSGSVTLTHQPGALGVTTGLIPPPRVLRRLPRPRSRPAVSAGT
jgi:hypothetical protein